METPCVEAADDSFHAESPIPTCSELRKKGPVLFLPTMEHLTDEEFQNVPKYLIMTFFLCRYYYLTPATAGKTLFLVIFVWCPIQSCWHHYRKAVVVKLSALESRHYMRAVKLMRSLGANECINALKNQLRLKILIQEKLMQSSGANSEHKRSEIEHFLALNECNIVKTRKIPSLSIVSKFSDLH